MEAGEIEAIEHRFRGRRIKVGQSRGCQRLARRLHYSRHGRRSPALISPPPMSSGEGHEGGKSASARGSASPPPERTCVYVANSMISGPNAARGQSLSTMFLLTLAVSSLLLGGRASASCAPRASPYAVPLGLLDHQSSTSTGASTADPAAPSPAQSGNERQNDDDDSSVAGDPISKICGKGLVTFPQVCQQIAQANPSAVAAGTLGVLKAHIEITKAKALAAIGIAKALAANPTFDKITRENLGDTCVENFNDANSDLDSLSAAIAANDQATAQVDSAGASTNIGTCEDQFNDPMFTDDPKPSPMASTNKELEELGENIVDLTANWAKSH